jgi:uncharacterized protein YoxC
MIDLNELLVNLAIFVGVCLGAAVLVLLIVVLINVVKTIKKVNKILDDNTENIDKTTKKIPLLLESVDNTVTSVGGITDGVNDLFVGRKSSSDTALSIINIVESAANVALGFLSKKK